MTAKDFRRIALSLPESIESSHMDHPDFRVGGKIFATLDAPSKGWGMVKLWPDQQAEFINQIPKHLSPRKAPGASAARLSSSSCGKKGHCPPRAIAAWRNTAPKTHRRQTLRLATAI